MLCDSLMVSELARAFFSSAAGGFVVLAVPAFPAPVENFPLVLLGASELLAAFLVWVLSCWGFRRLLRHLPLTLLRLVLLVCSLKFIRRQGRRRQGPNGLNYVYR